MKTNESMLDRFVRAVVGLVGIGLWVFGYLTGVWAVVAVVVGAVLLLTGLLGFCPLYAALGIGTAPKKPAKRAG